MEYCIYNSKTKKKKKTKNSYLFHAYIGSINYNNQIILVFYFLCASLMCSYC